jgi:hypothetical protein
VELAGDAFGTCGKRLPCLVEDTHVSSRSICQDQIAVRRILSRSAFPKTERGLERVEELTFFTAEMA